MNHQTVININAVLLQFHGIFYCVHDRSTDDVIFRQNCFFPPFSQWFFPATTVKDFDRVHVLQIKIPGNDLNFFPRQPQGLM